MKKEFELPLLKVKEFSKETLITASGEPKVTNQSVAENDFKENGISVNNIIDIFM